MDMQQLDGEWSVDKVLELINKHCRSWRGEGMKVRTYCDTLSSGIQSFSGITIHDYTFSRCLRSYDLHMSKKVTPRNSSFHMLGGLSYHEGKYFLFVYADSHICCLLSICK
jgi:hypothetical protein